MIKISVRIFGTVKIGKTLPGASDPLIWQSVTLMTSFDIAATAFCGFVVWRYVQTRRAMHGAYSGGRYFVIGVSIFGLFYAFDLLIMHILPPMIGADAAMASMRVLHQEWNWVANVIALGFIAFGFHTLRRNLLLWREDEREQAEALRESERRFQQFAHSQ